MKKKNIVFIIAYFVILAIPALGMPFFLNAKNTENRKLSEFPSIVKDGRINEKFTDGVDNFVNDRIGFRQYFVTMNTMLKTGVFKQSTEDSIVLGKDGWLFYSDTVDDYMGIQTLSDRNIQNIVNTYEMVSKRLNSDGKTLVFTVIPNKNSVYPEYMPDTYIEGDKGNLFALTKAIEKSDLPYADVKNELTIDNTILYQAADSHWTYEGALLGYKTIMNKSGLSFNEFEGLDFEEKNDWEADLGTMLYSVNAKADLQKYPKYDFSFEYTSHEKEPDSIKLSTYNESGAGNAVVYRDSFMNAGHVYFAENFENCLFSRAFPYKLDLAYDEEADFVLIEIVERNIKNLATTAPVMAAEAVDDEAYNEALKIDSGDFEVSSVNENGYTHVFGVVEDLCLGIDNEIFVKAGNVCYKAFPIYEQSLLESEEMGDNGFSLYIPETEEIKSSDIEVYVRRLD